MPILAVSYLDGLAVFDGPKPAVLDATTVAVSGGFHPHCEERLILSTSFSTLWLVPIPSPIPVVRGGDVYFTFISLSQGLAFQEGLGLGWVMTPRCFRISPSSACSDGRVVAGRTAGLSVFFILRI